MSLFGENQTSSTATLNKFCEVMLEFLECVNEVFPECVDTATALMQMRVLMTTDMTESKDTLVREWHKKMLPHYESCVKKNDNMILNADIPLLSKWHLGLSPKPQPLRPAQPEVYGELALALRVRGGNIGSQTLNYVQR